MAAVGWAADGVADGGVDQGRGLVAHGTVFGPRSGPYGRVRSMGRVVASCGTRCRSTRRVPWAPSHRAGARTAMLRAGPGRPCDGAVGNATTGSS